MQDQINVKEALNERSGFQVWWRLLRPHTLTAAFVPVFIGTTVALSEGNIHIPLFLAMLFASVLIQIATNMFNEYYDYKLGLDTEQSVGIGGTIVRDGVSPKVVLNLAFILFAIAILLGVYISVESSWWIAVIGSISMLFGYLYTGGPIPIAYTPFGELFAGLFMGTGIVMISYFIQTHTISLNIFLISLPIAIFIGAILLSNNIRDLDNDKESGRRTIAILLGKKNAIWFLASLFILAYCSTLLFIFTKTLPVWSLITLISCLKAFQVIKGFQGKTKPLEMMPAMVATGQTNTIYGLLLGISILLSIYL